MSRTRATLTLGMLLTGFILMAAVLHRAPIETYEAIALQRLYG